MRVRNGFTLVDPLEGRARQRAAFTLVELLVVIGIIAVLIGILLPALSRAQRQARTVRDMAAVKQLMTAYSIYATENRGKVLPGYYNGPALDELGNAVTFPANARYPWRLMPYLNKTLRGGILVGAQDERFGLRDLHDPAGWTYNVSVFPSFGLNLNNVGGDLVHGPVVTGGSAEYVTNIGQPKNPTELIVFASTRYNIVGSYEGYYEARQPVKADYVEGDQADLFGFVHPRYEKRALAGFFDGHAGLLDQKEICDVRYWKKR